MTRSVTLNRSDNEGEGSLLIPPRFFAAPYAAQNDVNKHYNCIPNTSKIVFIKIELFQTNNNKKANKTA